MVSPLNINNVESGFKCFWRIENFALYKPSLSRRLVSPRFKVNMLQDSEWYLELIEESRNKVDIGLFRGEKNDSKSINVYYSISVLTCSGWLAILSDECDEFISGGGGYGAWNFIDWHKTLTNHKHLSLPTESLTVCFHMWNDSTMSAQCLMTSRMVNENKVVHLPMQEFTSLKESDFMNWLVSNVPQPAETNYLVKENNNTQSTQTDSLVKDSIKNQCTQTDDSNLFDDLEDLLRLFKEKKFHDVTLRTANKEFAAHKAFLCARSPVFNVMFDTNMKESDDNVVNVDDIDNDTLASMLKFLHLEPLDDLKWEAAVKLFYAADEYQIKQLKSKCHSILKKELCEENVCEVLVLADMHQEEDLKSSALEFFCKNSKIVLRTLKWKDFMLERTELASEILSELAERM